jgi:hypothetical protein
MKSLFRLIAPVVFAVLASLAVVFPEKAHAADCAGTPSAAVMKLPSPLDEWGTIVCTEYGHIISNHDGWIWSMPGAYSPVFIPSQMVRDNPEPLGNRSYFLKIEMTKVAGKEFDDAYEAVHAGFAPDAIKPIGYRLDVVSVSSRSLQLYFFAGKSIWGIWCRDGKCDTSSRFMLLDMNHKPE